MAATIKIKNSSTTGAVPSASDLVQGELAVNVTDTGLYTENASGTVVKLNAPSIDDKNTGATKRMTIDTSGNVGVGVTPSAWGGSYKALQFSTGGLALTGTIQFLQSNGYNDGSWKFYGAGYANQSYIDSSDGSTTWRVSTASGSAGGAVTWSTQMRLDSSGNLLVGTTSGTENRIYKSSSTYSTRIENTSTSTGSTLLLQSGRSAGTGFTNIECYANGALNFQVLGNGNVQNTNNSYGAISDVKLKENIVDASPKLAQLNQVRVVNYNLIGDENKQLGVIAQELEQVFPSLVEEAPDRDVEGNDLGTTTKSVKYSVFVPMLIKAIQEQQAIITSLTARIEALEAA